jgi:hypothetical protein
MTTTNKMFVINYIRSSFNINDTFTNDNILELMKCKPLFEEFTNMYDNGIGRVNYSFELMNSLLI